MVCFPPGGGSATNYAGLAASFGPGPSVYAVQYPGRQNRIGEEFVSSITDLADHIVAATDSRISGSPVLFGHSVGATVAFETARLFPGGHFYLDEHAREIADLLTPSSLPAVPRRPEVRRHPSTVRSRRNTARASSAGVPVVVSTTVS
ncbi:thioesterase II family protein [Nocardia fusca]|uniref:thioesterase II family protein n=1 Tax=Nocardia fusca TaxID=941183 RepID=UPI0037B4506A